MSAPADQSTPHEQSIDAVVRLLGTDPVKGLTRAEARARLARHGRNELKAKPPVPAWRKFIAQFQGALVILLLIASAISAGLWLMERDSALPYEALTILAVVLLNAVMGYVQRTRAESAVAALRQMAAAHANVIRDGGRQNIPAAEIVPGDLVLIEEGDTIPADARLIQSTDLQTAEAALTGESLPVTKDIAPVARDAVLGDRRNLVFSGTTATQGRGQAIVTATGMQTEMGRIAGMIESVKEPGTRLQKELERLGRLLGGIVVAIATVMIATIIVVEEVRGFSELFEVLILGVALAVAAVPEGLPALVTTVLALGVQRMARRNAIVRHLAAVETLGSATVIASDKTGTLTKNEMTVRTVITAGGRIDFTGTGYAPTGEVKAAGGAPLDEGQRDELQRALTAAERANNAALQQHHGQWLVQGDPTEGALLVAAQKAGLDPQTLEARFKRVGEVPFSSERKLMSTVHTDGAEGGRILAFTKGASDVLLTRCSFEFAGGKKTPLNPERRTEIARSNEQLAGEALRTLGVAVRELPPSTPQSGNPGPDLEQELTFLGLIGMIDPPREEAKQAVIRARGAGIRPVMITGDHPKTAAVIAAELGIATDGRVVSGAELDTFSDEELAHAARTVSVYARVSPAHKLRIVHALRNGGATVAMTGDGVNDAPALKTADIGVAMGITGTDVSKEAADIVLIDDNFATIIAAVEEGRAIFANIRKFLRYLLSSNIGEVMTMFFGVILAEAIGLHAEGATLVLPLLATQILWINLMTDGAPALALGVDPADAELMNRPPRPVSERVITPRMWGGIIFTGAIMALGTLLALDASLPGGLIEGHGTIRYAQTMAFTTLTLFQLFNVFNARSEARSAFSGLGQNPWLWAAVGLSLGLHAAVIYTPFLQNAFSTVSLNGSDWLLCAAIASSILWLSELKKIVARARSN